MCTLLFKIKVQLVARWCKFRKFEIKWWQDITVALLRFFFFFWRMQCLYTLQEDTCLPCVRDYQFIQIPTKLSISFFPYVNPPQNHFSSLLHNGVSTSTLSFHVSSFQFCHFPFSFNLSWSTLLLCSNCKWLRLGYLLANLEKNSYLITYSYLKLQYNFS